MKDKIKHFSGVVIGALLAIAGFIEVGTGEVLVLFDGLMEFVGVAKESLLTAKVTIFALASTAYTVIKARALAAADVMRNG